MKKSGFCLLLFVALLSLLLSPSCSTTEEQAIVYDITGLWQFTITGGGGSETANFSFAGSVSAGVANDLTAGITGIYTVNNTLVEIVLNEWHPTCLNITRYYTGSFTSTTTMSGGYHAEYEGPCMGIGGITWTAIKL